MVGARVRRSRLRRASGARELSGVRRWWCWRLLVVDTARSIPIAQPPVVVVPSRLMMVESRSGRAFAPDAGQPVGGSSASIASAGPSPASDAVLRHKPPLLLLERPQHKRWPRKQCSDASCDQSCSTSASPRQRNASRLRVRCTRRLGSSRRTRRNTLARPAHPAARPSQPRSLPSAPHAQRCSHHPHRRRHPSRFSASSPRSTSTRRRSSRPSCGTSRRFIRTCSRARASGKRGRRAGADGSMMRSGCSRAS